MSSTTWCRKRSLRLTLSPLVRNVLELALASITCSLIRYCCCPHLRPYAAAANLDANYGVTSKIDEQLKLTATVEKATAKVDELKASLTSKVDDLKAKAATSE